MPTLESLWREAPPETEVCTIEGTTKNMVLAAITEGASDFASLSERVQLCKDNECAKINPSKRGCRENAQALLDIYVPVFQLMSQDGVYHIEKSAPEGCESRNGSCEGCRGCDL